jgi:phage/plasmid-like protein (TIGR03299 family)
MFSVREMPWHRQGEVLDDYPQSFAEARVLAGLDWDPVAYPVPADILLSPDQFRQHAMEILLRENGQPTAETAAQLTRLWEASFRNPDKAAEVIGAVQFGSFSGTIVSDAAREKWSRIARSDTGATLSYQRDSYHVVPNSAFGEIIDAILGTEPGTVKLETGGCLAGGKKVWMLARLDEPHQVQAGGRIDASYSFPYLGVTSDHTGNASCCARLTEVRIVCGNTFGAAEAEGKRTGAVFSFSHRGNWRDRLEEARGALQFARQENAEYVTAMSDLLGIKVTPDQQQMWLKEFIPAPPDGIISDRVMANIEEARAAVLGFLSGPTVEGAGIGGTAYGLVQAAGEYLDHARTSRTWESKLNRNLLKSEPLKAKAAKLAREAALA